MNEVKEILDKGIVAILKMFLIQIKKAKKTGDLDENKLIEYGGENLNLIIHQLDAHYNRLHFGFVCNCLREQEFAVDSMTKSILIKEFAKIFKQKGV